MALSWQEEWLVSCVESSLILRTPPSAVCRAQQLYRPVGRGLCSHSCGLVTLGLSLEQRPGGLEILEL